MGRVSGLLLLDVGNTNIKIGLDCGEGIAYTFCLPTPKRATADSMGSSICNLLANAGMYPEDVQHWIVSSVVPHLEKAISGAGRRWCNCAVQFVPRDIGLEIDNHYRRPEEVGADRLVCAYAATRLFSCQSFIVIDFGTATTFDCVTGNTYLGGLICPGILSSIQSLGTQTAKLPRVDLSGAANQALAIGQSTRQSLQNGLLYGFSSMVQGVCARLKGFVAQEPRIVATGGLAEEIAAVTPEIDIVQRDLLLQGLKMAFMEKSNKSAAEG